MTSPLQLVAAAVVLNIIAAVPALVLAVVRRRRERRREAVALMPAQLRHAEVECGRCRARSPLHARRCSACRAVLVDSEAA